MQAMHGFAALRKRTRLIGCSMAMVFATLVFASTANAEEPPEKTYLGLGDSLAFGYSQQLFNENFPTEKPSRFNNGFVNDYFDLLQASTVKGGGTAEEEEENVWRLTNNGCPGETTDSFIGNGVLAKELAVRGAVGAPACAYHNVTKFRLHHSYGEPYTFEGKETFRSQLENALKVIKANNKSATPEHPVTIISLEIGANDKLNRVKQCEKEVQEEYEQKGKSDQYGGATPEESFKNCVGVNAFVTLKHIIVNQIASMYAIRHGHEYCVNATSTPCDAAHKGVDYTGKIILGGAYDPYGRVFCKGETFASPGNAPPKCVPGPEVLPFSNSLTAIFNNQEQNKSAPSAAACYANPQPVFNPSVIPGKEAEGAEHEPFQLQTLTNMDNKTTSNGKPNGDGRRSDIHPTPLGYKEIANVNAATCGL
jgi:hypothetical protein